MTRVAVLLALLTLAACGGDFWNRPATIPGAAPLWQNAPSNSTYEPMGSRPRGS